MLIREAIENEKNQWNQFNVNNEMGSFLQSYEWGEFRASIGNKVWRLVAEENGEWIGIMQFYKTDLKLGQSVLYCPKGPIISKTSETSVQRDKRIEMMIGKVDEIAGKEKALVLQMDPNTNDKEWCAMLDSAGFDKAEEDSQPRHTLILDIRKTEEDLLAQMHQKTRYNINLAQKKGIEIVVDDSQYKEFHELLKKTEARQGINMFSEKYFKNILNLPFVKLYLAKFEGKIVAANIMIFWNHTATYLFGASDYEYRQLMAPHLLQWQAIKDAKKAEGWFYDFWGAAPPDATGRETNWAGFTKFKMGFSPNAELTEYIGTYEKMYSPIIMGLYRYLRTRFKR